jgi:dTMP kinase
MAYAKDFPISMTMELNKIALDGIFPDKIIMLELSPEELSRRLAGKENDGIESRGIEYLLEIQSKMKTIIGDLNINNLIVDASLPIETIAKNIEDFMNGQ